MSPLRPALLACLAAPLAACATPGQNAAVGTAPRPVVVATPLAPRPGPAQPVTVVTPRPGQPVVVVTPGPATVAVAAPPAPPPYPQHWDGSYQGGSVLVRASSRACPPSRRGVIEIGDSTIFFPYQPDLIFTTAVRSDGSMHGVAGQTHLDGRIVGDRLTMTISSPTCETQYRARYIWNHSYPP